MTLQFGMRAAFILAIASLTAALVALLTPGRSHGQAEDAPVLTFSSPAHGATISEPAFVIQLCFADPISIRDLSDSSDFYTVTAPDEFRPGPRTVFQGDGYGVTIYPNNASVETPEGEWRVDYHVSSPDTSAATEGQIVFTVDPDGEKLPQTSPPRCLPSGFTATPGPSPSVTEPPASTTAPPEDTDTPVPTESPATDGDDGSDTLLIVLLVLGAAGGLALTALIGYLARRRRTQEPQAPPPDEETRR